MREVLTTTACGVKQIVTVAGVFGLLVLSSCSFVILVELRNDSSETIHVRDVTKGLVALSPSETVLIDPGKDLMIMINGLPRRFFAVNRVPARFVKSTRKGYVVFYAVVREDGLLYLANKTREGVLAVLERQPAGFPLAAQESQSEELPVR